MLVGGDSQEEVVDTMSRIWTTKVESMQVRRWNTQRKTADYNIYTVSSTVLRGRTGNTFYSVRNYGNIFLHTKIVISEDGLAEGLA